MYNCTEIMFTWRCHIQTKIDCNIRLASKHLIQFYECLLFKYIFMYERSAQETQNAMETPKRAAARSNRSSTSDKIIFPLNWWILLLLLHYGRCPLRFFFQISGCSSVSFVACILIVKPRAHKHTQMHAPNQIW